MIVAIHQPNFMPWYPFFQKMREVDVFVILTRCQFEKNGLQNRFRIHDKWKTLSVRRGLDSILSKQYIQPTKDWNAIKKSLPSYKVLLNSFGACICNSLADTNISIIRKLANLLKIKTKIVLDTPTDLTSTQRLVSICKQHKASAYLSGSSGRNYLDELAFVENDIEVLYQGEAALDKRSILEVL